MMNDSMMNEQAMNEQAMNEQAMNEQISALIDRRENPRHQRDMFDHIMADDGARKVWQRYHLIGCVLRGEVDRTGADLSVRIRARLEDEPTVLSPTRRLALLRSPLRMMPRIPIWKSAGALALAASIALAAVITLNPIAPEQGAGLTDNGVRFEQEVGEMLAQHGEFTSSPGLNGLVVYAKLVSNEPIER